MMKPKTVAKKTLSVILCVVMLISCWVFTAPQASAADATTVAELVAERAVEYGLYMYYSDFKYIRSTLNGNGCFEEAGKINQLALWYVESVSGGYKIYTYVNGAKKYIHNSSDKNVELANTGDTFTITPKDGGFYLKKSNENKWLQHSNGGGGLRYYTDNNNATNSIIKFQYPETYALTTYKIQVRIEVTSKCQLAQESYMRVEFNDGSSKQLYKSGGYDDYGGGTYTCESTSYPKLVRMNAHPWWPAGKLVYKIHYSIFNYTQNGYKETNTSGSITAEGNRDHVKTLNITQPYAAHIAPILGRGNLPLDPNGGTFSRTYKAGVVTDQYGYKYGTSSIACTPPNGVTFSNNVLSAGVGSNRANDYTCTITGSYGSLTTSKTVTVKTFNYNVTFKDYDGTVIDDSQTNLEYGTSATAPANPSRPSTDTKVYTFSHWAPEGDYDYDYTNLAGVQNQVYTAQYTESDRHYTVTFQKEDGTVISSNDDMLYESVPSQAGIVPALIEKEPDDNGHYTAAWDRDVTQPITGDTIFKIVYTLVPHTWEDPAGVVKTPATCTTTGVNILTCSVCHHEVETSTPINPNNHVWERKQSEEIDLNKTIKVYYQCSMCEQFTSAEYNSQTQEYFPEGTASAGIPADDHTQVIHTPQFNSYDASSSEVQCNYNNRPASLRVRRSEIGESTQAMRFAGAMDIAKVYSDISLAADPAKITSDGKTVKSLDEIRANIKTDFADDCLIDFGYVYTQARYITETQGGTKLDWSKLQLGGNKIARMSVVANNYGKAAFNGSNWKGVTFDNLDSNKYLTFNLVIGIKNYNYPIVYVACPYVVYKYHGEMYVLYDQPSTTRERIGGKMVTVDHFSHDSVLNLANKVKNATNVTIPQPVQTYLQTKIFNFCESYNFKYRDETKQYTTLDQ